MFNPAAPAPASDLTLATAPPFIALDDGWDDAEWRAAAATPAGRRTPAQSYMFAGGPRPHPWGAGAFVGFMADGRRAYFPSEQAFRTWADENNHGAADAAPPEAGASALGAINAGLAQAAKPPGDPDVEDERHEGAAPNGAAAT